MTKRDVMFVNGECGPDRPHVWKSAGGRACAHSHRAEEDTKCAAGFASQAVYRCMSCGEYDYGDKGGPGFADCVKHCGVKA